MKKGNSIITAVTLIALLFAITGCKKYEEGPGFSMYSKMSRLSNNYWYLEKVFSKEGVDISYDWAVRHECYTLNYDKQLFDKEMTYQIDYQDYTTQHAERGDFELSDDKIYITHKPVEPTEFTDILEYRFKILRLTNKEFWFIDERTGNEFHMTSMDASTWCGFQI